MMSQRGYPLFGLLRHAALAVRTEALSTSCLDHLFVRGQPIRRDKWPKCMSINTKMVRPKNQVWAACLGLACPQLLASPSIVLASETDMFSFQECKIVSRKGTHYMLLSHSCP